MTNSVFIFNEEGKFLSKIQRIGRGPGEYLSLMDCAYDEKNSRLILHSDRPYKFIYLDLDGRFVSEKSIQSYYDNISLVEDKLVSVNISNKKYRVVSTNLSIQNEKGLLPFSNTGKVFSTYRLTYPHTIQSKNNYISFCYSDTVYHFKNGILKPKYLLNFGEHNAPEKLFYKGLSASQVSKEARDRAYGFHVANFRESLNFICFSYGEGTIVIYSKKERVAKSFTYIENPTELLHFQNYFAHDGNDDKMISIYPATLFKRQMHNYKSMPEKWKMIPDYIKAIDTDVDDLSNPLLFICEFKK